jgi:hypothetical protein
VAISVDIFDQIISANQIEEAMRDHLKLWMPVYIQEMELQLGRERGKVPVPRSFMIAGGLEQMKENQLPGILIQSPGTTSVPTHDGSGMYTANWRMALTAFISALDQDSTRAVAKLYGAAMRAIIVQKPSLGGFAINSRWTSESYSDEPSPDGERNLTLASVTCEVTVENVVNKMGGPRTFPDVDPPDPATQPGSHWELATKVIIGINGEIPIIEPDEDDINLKGHVPTVADLPQTGNETGDAYIVDADGRLYVWREGVNIYVAIP